MKHYARIRDGLVINTEIGDEFWPEIAAGNDLLIEYDPDLEGILYSWSEQNGFLPPTSTETEEPPNE